MLNFFLHEVIEQIISYIEKEKKTNRRVACHEHPYKPYIKYLLVKDQR